MTNIEKVRTALELMLELKEDTRDNELLQMFVDNSIKGLQGVMKWINT